MGLRKLATVACAAVAAVSLKTRRTTCEIQDDRVVRHGQYRTARHDIRYDQIAALQLDRDLLDVALGRETVVVRLERGDTVRLDHVPQGTHRALKERVADYSGE